MGSMADNPWQKEKISEIEDTVIKTILNETQKKKKRKKAQTLLTQNSIPIKNSFQNKAKYFVSIQKQKASVNCIPTL